MTAISIGMRQAKHQEYVEEIVKACSPKTIDNLVKAFILSQVTPCEHGFEISENIQKASNRVPVLPDAEAVAAALSVAGTWWSYSLAKQKGFEVEFED